jgi:hypothetical protein
MKRLVTHIIYAILTLGALSGCTKNNGDIGLWFGLWHLDAIEIDGNPDPQYDGNYYFMFQSQVFCVRYIFEQDHEQREAFAKWQESDDGKTITINFADSRYNPHLGDDIPSNYLSTITTLTVDSLTATSMVLHYTSDDATITYHLTLWR